MAEQRKELRDAKKTTILSLAYMYEYVCDITEYCEKYEYDFTRMRADRMGAHGLIQCLAIIGEHARSIRQKDPDFVGVCPLPLHEMAGMRNRIEHQYKLIDWDIVQETVKESIPQLKAFLEENISRDILENPYSLYEA